MTVNPAKTQRKAMMVEFLADQIIARYNDGSLEIDADLLEEKGQVHTVDGFIRPKELPDNDKFIVTNDRFREQFSLWGPVREQLANNTEKNEAQISFNSVEARAQVILGDFTTALKNNRVTVKQSAPGQAYQLYYQDPRTGVERVFHLYPENGEPKSNPPRFTTLSLEEDFDHLRVSISDPRRLAPLRKALDPIFQDFVKKNRALEKHR